MTAVGPVFCQSYSSLLNQGYKTFQVRLSPFSPLCDNGQQPVLVGDVQFEAPESRKTLPAAMAAHLFGLKNGLVSIAIV